MGGHAAMSKLVVQLLVVALLIGSGAVDAGTGRKGGKGGKGGRGDRGGRGRSIFAALQVNYYQKSCPGAEAIVLREMTQIFNAVPAGPDAEMGPNVAPDLLRLHFHDCFVQGCDASVLLDGPGTEKASPSNARLEGFDFVDTIKAALEAKCPQVVSCSDLLAFAARDAVVLTGGRKYVVPAGRKDGFTSYAALATANLPGPQMSVNQLTANFMRQGLSQDDMVVLSGAHTIGDAACHHIDNRLYKFAKSRSSKTGAVDAGLPPDFVTELKAICPRPGLRLTAIAMDQVTPIKFDTQYYRNLQSRRSVLSSDQALFDDHRTRPTVNLLARNPSLFHKAFGDAMVKMGDIGGLHRGPFMGEVRRNCRKVNARWP